MGGRCFARYSTPTVRTLAWLISANRDLDLYETAGYRHCRCRGKRRPPKRHRDRCGSSGNSVALRFSRRYPSARSLYPYAPGKTQARPQRPRCSERQGPPSLSPAGQNGRCGKARGESAGGFLEPRGLARRHRRPVRQRSPNLQLRDQHQHPRGPCPMASPRGKP